jgi:hypothetical protein
MTQPRTKYAMIDQAHQPRGLFVMTQGRAGSRPDPAVEQKNHVVDGDFGDLHIRFASVFVLGDIDLSVFLVLLSLAASRGQSVSPDSIDVTKKAQHSSLAATGNAARRPGVAVSTTVREIVSEVGLSACGTASDDVRAALERLGSVVLWTNDRSSGTKGNSLMLAIMIGDDDVEVVVNYRLRESMMNVHGFTRIDLAERRGLSTPTSRFLHAFFSRWIRPGIGQKISLQKLAAHIWADALGADKDVRYRRRAALVKALHALTSLEGWSVTQNGEDSVTICRQPPSERLPREKARPALRKGATEHEKSRDRHRSATA